MSKKIYIGIISLLLIIIIGQALFLYKNDKSIDSNSDIDEIFQKPRNSHSLLNKLKEKFKKDNKSTKDIFDNFFDDNFFNTHKDPFHSIDEMRESLFNNFEEDEWNFFGRNWDDWYEQRFGESDIQASTKEKDDKVIMKINVPGLKDNTLNVDMNEKNISIDCEIKEIKEKKDSHGNVVYKLSSHQQFSKILPTPENVDISKSEIKTNKDEIIITFKKLE